MITRHSRKVVFYNMPAGSGKQYPVAGVVHVTDKGEVLWGDYRYTIYSQEVDADSDWHINECWLKPVSTIRLGHKSGLNAEALLAVLIEHGRVLRETSKLPSALPKEESVERYLEDARWKACEPHLIKAMEALTGKPFRDETRLYCKKKTEKPTE